MLTIGCHLSASKGYLAMGETAISIGANTFQFFTRNPRGSKAKPVDEADIAAYTEFAKKHGIDTILAHAPYTLNLASDDADKREFALNTMLSDLDTLEKLPGRVMYNFHPGNHMKQGSEKGIEYISQGLNNLIREDQKTQVLLETMSGKGTEIGRNFEEIRDIRNSLAHPQKVGVCLDTCHVSDGGYDIISNLDEVLEAFDRIIGLEHLQALHVNDSKNPIGSHKDRHEKIGEGCLGLETFKQIVTNKYLKKLPMYLETPNELDGYRAEIALLRRMEKENHTKE